MIAHQIYFPKTHNIIELLELCSPVDPSFKAELEEADKLTDYAVEIRYPDMLPEPSLEEAKEALSIAKIAGNFILKKLGE